jgi:hypothetical protein
VIVSVDDQSLSMNNGRCLHHVRWSDGRLECARSDYAAKQSTIDGVQVSDTKLPDWLNCQKRFVKFNHSTVIAAVDIFGQLALFDNDRNLLCMFFTFRDKLAAWMPDGTRFGSKELLGEQPTPGASEKIAAALDAACRQARRTVV